MSRIDRDVREEQIDNGNAEGVKNLELVSAIAHHVRVTMYTYSEDDIRAVSDVADSWRRNVDDDEVLPTSASCMCCPTFWTRLNSRMSIYLQSRYYSLFASASRAAFLMGIPKP